MNSKTFDRVNRLIKTDTLDQIINNYKGEILRSETLLKKRLNHCLKKPNCRETVS